MKVSKTIYLNDTDIRKIFMEWAEARGYVVNKISLNVCEDKALLWFVVLMEG